MASIVEYEVLKTNWVLLSMFVDNKYSLICLYSSFSKTLESAPVMEIGLQFSAISGPKIVLNKFIYKKCKV